MLMPSIFGENLFDDWFDEFPFYDMDKEMNNTEKKLYGKKAGRIMKTDIKEQKDGYELMIDLPGFTKDEIKASVEDGYLTISAAKGLDKDEKEKDSGHYIRKERYAGACQRSFYVGEDIEQEDVKAEFKHGILKLFVPKKEAKKAVEENKYIAIEGYWIRYWEPLSRSVVWLLFCGMSLDDGIVIFCNDNVLIKKRICE